MAYDVFVSYSSKDKIIADTIVAAMENNHIRCWYAPRDIKPGEDWGKGIASAIEGCRVFLVIFSKNANRSQRVLDEVNLAISQQVVILPFRIENLEPDGAMKLHLSSRHWLDAFEPSWEVHINKLIKDVFANLEASIEDEEIVVPEGMKKQTKQRKTLFRIMSGVVGAAILITAGWFGWKSQNEGDQEIPALTATDVSIPQESSAVQELATATTAPTPIPAWAEEFSEPILSAIENQPPDFSDDFTHVDNNWISIQTLLHSDESCSNTDGAAMEISDGSLKISVDSNCPQAVITHPQLRGWENCLIQADINFNGQIFGNIFFRRFYDTIGTQLDFGLYSSGGWHIQQLKGDMIFANTNRKFHFDNSIPITVTIIYKDSMLLVYLDSTLVASLDDLELFFGPGNNDLNIDNENPRLKGSVTFELDNVKVWDLDNLVY